jgi:tRNA U38,U39,U40 pseudouridine synthase TruA
MCIYLYKVWNVLPYVFAVSAVCHKMQIQRDHQDLSLFLHKVTQLASFPHMYHTMHPAWYKLLTFCMLYSGVPIYRRNLDIPAMEQGAQHLVGEHDFRY